MKIALCCRVYSTHERVGGMIHVVVERAEQLAREGHDVHVLTTNAPGHPIAERVNGVMVHHSPGTPQQYSTCYADFCNGLCRDMSPKILHLDSFDKNRLWWTDRPGNPQAVVVSIHGEGVGSQFTDWRLRRHNLTASSPNNEAGMANSGNGIDTREWEDEARWLQSADTVITTCRLDRWFMSDLLGLRRVRLVRNPLAPYHFQGRSPAAGPRQNKFLFIGVWGHGERGYSIAEAACTSLGVQLLVPANVARPDLVKWYDQCDAMLLPTYQSKGYDLSVAECTSRLRPTFMGDAGISTFESIDHPWIVPVRCGDVQALINAMSAPIPTVPADAADEHRPENHTKAWFNAILGG